MVLVVHCALHTACTAHSTQQRTSVAPCRVAEVRGTIRPPLFTYCRGTAVLSSTMMIGLCTLASLALLHGTRSQMTPPLPKCHMGLVWPNATETLPMVAGLSAEECAEIALNNSQHASSDGSKCDDKNECNVMAYSYCEVSAQCGCLAGMRRVQQLVCCVGHINP
jgi:hypothetical protein